MLKGGINDDASTASSRGFSYMINDLEFVFIGFRILKSKGRRQSQECPSPYVESTSSPSDYSFSPYRCIRAQDQQRSHVGVYGFFGLQLASRSRLAADD
ncbi:hypothetical protein COLO4_02604 [Corchorus olitorius]|uniref:Uncharacterized protein n=1 Tax=Corchorus olitorius TaxID=93759 RepID=A0A1R3L0M4_9ROSI|nr:hypothetical protein COLO4_02604 [Corchorus olitorius]